MHLSWTTTAVASNRPTEALASVIYFTFVVYSRYKTQSWTDCLCHKSSMDIASVISFFWLWPCRHLIFSIFFFSQVLSKYQSRLISFPRPLHAPQARVKVPGTRLNRNHKYLLINCHDNHIDFNPPLK